MSQGRRGGHLLFVGDVDLERGATDPLGDRPCVGEIDVQHRHRGAAARECLADRRTDLQSSVIRAVPAAEENVPSQALASSNGGTISTDPRDNKGTKAFERMFQFDVALPDSGPDGGSDASALAASGFGARVFVRFDFTWEPLGSALYRHIRQGMLSRFET